MKIGDEIDGKKVYGKNNTLKGTIIDIKHSEIDGLYKLNDIITIKWDNGQQVKFYNRNL
jgi:hypothetical protein